jgi:hypothetical protein
MNDNSNVNLGKMLQDKLKLHEAEIFYADLIILLYLYRAVIPFFKYFFLVSYSIFILYNISRYHGKIISVLKEFMVTFRLVLFLLSIMIICLTFSDKLYLVPVKDTVNVIVLLSLFFNLMLIISNKDDFIRLVHVLIKLALVFALLVSVIHFLIFFNVFNSENYFTNTVVFRTALTDIKIADENFALVPVFFGIVGILYYLRNEISTRRKFSFNLLLLIFSLQICFSGSRRGLITLDIIWLFLLITGFLVLIKRHVYLKKLITNLKYYFLSMVLLTLVFIWFIFFAPSSLKNKSARFLSPNNAALIKSNLSFALYRYVSVIDGNISPFDFYRLFWSMDYDPYDPDSGWGKGKFSNIYPLSGKNVQIVPPGARGFLLDSTCTSKVAENRAYFQLPIGMSHARTGDIVDASIYCYVSEDFNGDLVGIFSEGSTYGNKVSGYNLNEKGIWKRLSISVKCTQGDAPVYLGIFKVGATSFSKLNGYVIFAFPQYEIRNVKGETPSLSRPYSNGNNSKSTSNNLLNGNIQTDDRRSSEQLEIRNEINSAKNYEPVETIIQLDHPLENIELFRKTAIQSSLLGFKEIGNLNILIDLNDSDPIRNWINKFVHEDTTYHGYKANLNVGIVEKSMIDGRKIRWKFAMKIYSLEYSWKQKVFGGGFNFLNWYGNYFYSDRTRSDYPHNPFLSVLLYSGIFGLMFYMFFIYKVFFYYIKYLKACSILAVFFSIIFFFSFFSAGSPFDPPIMGFFVLLPFLMNSRLNLNQEVRSDINFSS